MGFIADYISSPYMAQSFGGNTVEQYLFAFLVFLGVYIVLKIFKLVILSRIKALFKKTKTKVDDIVIEAVEAVHWPFYLFVSIYVALFFVALPAIISRIVYFAIIIVATYYVVRVLQRLIDYMSEKYADKKANGTAKANVDDSALRLLNSFLKISLWVVAVTLILSNMGYSIAPLLAGVGVGGLAIAFALQNVLSDIFASISIYFDKPFVTGDFIVVGGDSGTVKHIGLKSTRIQTLQGQELVVSNKELTETRVNNYKKLTKRRVVFSVGVTYDTPKAKLEKIPSMVEAIMKKQKLADFNRAHLKSFGPSSLDYEIVYYLNSKDYADYMDTQQAINLGLVGVFNKAKIEFAFPTQTLYVSKMK